MPAKISSSKAKRPKKKAAWASPILKRIAQLKALATKVREAAEDAPNGQPPASLREEIRAAAEALHTVVRDNLAEPRSTAPDPEAKFAEMPRPDADGHYPASETLRAILAHQIAERRQQAGLSQIELAERAGVRAETVSRLEGGKHAPTVRTVEKIDRALTAAGV